MPDQYASMVGQYSTCACLLLLIHPHPGVTWTKNIIDTGKSPAITNLEKLVKEIACDLQEAWGQSA